MNCGKLNEIVLFDIKLIMLTPSSRGQRKSHRDVDLMISEYSGSLIKFKLTDHTLVMIVEFFLIGIYFILFPLVFLYSSRIGLNNTQGCN